MKSREFAIKRGYKDVKDMLYTWKKNDYSELLEFAKNIKNCDFNDKECSHNNLTCSFAFSSIESIIYSLMKEIEYELENEIDITDECIYNLTIFYLKITNSLENLNLDILATVFHISFRYGYFVDFIIELIVENYEKRNVIELEYIYNKEVYYPIIFNKLTFINDKIINNAIMFNICPLTLSSAKRYQIKHKSTFNNLLNFWKSNDNIFNYINDIVRKVRFCNSDVIIKYFIKNDRYKYLNIENLISLARYISSNDKDISNYIISILPEPIDNIFTKLIKSESSICYNVINYIMDNYQIEITNDNIIDLINYYSCINDLYTVLEKFILNCAKFDINIVLSSIILIRYDNIENIIEKLISYDNNITNKTIELLRNIKIDDITRYGLEYGEDLIKCTFMNYPILEYYMKNTFIPNYHKPFWYIVATINYSSVLNDNDNINIDNLNISKTQIIKGDRSHILRNTIRKFITENEVYGYFIQMVYHNMPRTFKSLKTNYIPQEEGEFDYVLLAKLYTCTFRQKQCK